MSNINAPARSFSSLLAKNRVQIFVGTALFVLAFFLRVWRLSSAPDIFGDEVLYVDIAVKLPQYGQLMAFGAPWFVHPPLFYMLQSTFFQFLGIKGVTLSNVFNSRLTSAFYSSLTVLVVFALVTKVSNIKIGAISAVVLAFEPYALKYSRLGLLESAVILFVTLALYMYYSADAGQNAKKFLFGGVFFGLALLTKELAFYVLVVLVVWVLLMRFVTKTHFNVKGTLIFVSTGVLMYLGYVAWALYTDAPAFLSANSLLLQRAVGIVRNTGYTAPNYPSFMSDLVSSMNLYLMTYLLVALSAVSCVYLLYRYRDRAAVMFTSWFVGSVIFFEGIGIHNPQFFTYLTVPAAVVSGYTLGKLALEPHKLTLRLKKLSYAAVLLLIVVVSYNAFVWYTADGTGSDTAVAQSVRWIQANVPSGEKIWSAYSYQYFLPQDTVYDIGSLHNLKLMKGQEIHYFVYSPRWINLVDKSAMQYIQAGRLVAVFYGQSTQEVYVYYIPNPI